MVVPRPALRAASATPRLRPPPPEKRSTTRIGRSMVSYEGRVAVWRKAWSAAQVEQVGGAAVLAGPRGVAERPTLFLATAASPKEECHRSPGAIVRTGGQSGRPARAAGRYVGELQLFAPGRDGHV